MNVRSQYCLFLSGKLEIGTKYLLETCNCKKYLIWFERSREYFSFMHQMLRQDKRGIIASPKVIALRLLVLHLRGARRHQVLAVHPAAGALSRIQCNHRAGKQEQDRPLTGDLPPADLTSVSPPRVFCIPSSQVPDFKQTYKLPSMTHLD